MNQAFGFGYPGEPGFDEARVRQLYAIAKNKLMAFLGYVGQVSPDTLFLVYGRGFASFVAGKFRSSYTQSDNFSGVIPTTSWKDDRIVPILDLELGVGWRSQRERFLVSGGYLVSAGWSGIVSNAEFIRGVQLSQPLMR